MKKLIRAFSPILAALLALGLQIVPLNAQNTKSYLKSSDLPDAVKFLPPPPSEDSDAFALDKAIHFSSKALRDTPRGIQAIREVTTNTDTMALMFSGAFGMELSREKTPRIMHLLTRAVKTLRLGANAPKKAYMRPRPYVYFNEGTLYPPEEEENRNTGSYPSGHTIRGWGMALLLSQINPARQDTLLSVGYEWGQSRVISGYHWQSDVDAARTLTSACYARLQACPEFTADMKAAKEEFRRMSHPDSPRPELPDSVIIKTLSREHVQGMAVDTLEHCLYMSFTTSFKKVDFDGYVLASVDSLNGHLGAMVFDPVSRRVYASLECKDDEIGSSISRHLGAAAYSREDTRFLIAEIMVDSLKSIGTPSGKVMKTYLVEEAVKDYKTRYGCSGIDGVALAPPVGKKKGLPRLYVAYGIYGDESRTDNDHQIILEYAPGNLSKPRTKYFVYTGNTRYGVQNMAFDPFTGNLFLACYKGRKPQFPNHTLFAVPLSQKPVKKVLKGLENDGKHPLLKLDGQKEGYIPGWDFSKASTGLCTVGGGVWFNSSPVKTKGGQTCIVRKLIWTGESDNPFRKP